MMKENPDTAERSTLSPKARSRDVPPSSLEEVREEARRRIRAKRGIFASLSPEARELILSYDGPEFLGPLDSKFRL
jgi:hypothetical protein